jgi:hypothetical protein
MMGRISAFLVVFSVFLSLKAQNTATVTPPKNLVPNGSFENYRKKSNSIKNAIPWKDAGTIDFYQNPLTNDTTAQKGAYDGNCYIGFRFQKR